MLITIDNGGYPSNSKLKTKKYINIESFLLLA
jgi:hypothetical protein